MDYEHTQPGRYALPVFLALTAVLLIVIAFSSVTTGGLISMAVFLVFIGVVLAGFNRLTVSVNGSNATVRFRWGWPSRKLDLADVHRVDKVRNKAWYGFGVRLTPHGWMYNVWGLDAVQLNFSDGKTFRIGTDEPDALAAAIANGAGLGDDTRPDGDSNSGTDWP